MNDNQSMQYKVPFDASPNGSEIMTFANFTTDSEEESDHEEVSPKPLNTSLPVLYNNTQYSHDDSEREPTKSYLDAEHFFNAKLNYADGGTSNFGYIPDAALCVSKPIMLHLSSLETVDTTHS